MCGINGYMGFEAGRQGLQAVERMNAAMQHRGPDHLGTWADDHLAFGHARLSIIDLSAAAHQPFVSACGRYIMVFNGELYNFAEVRQQLLLHDPSLVFRTTSDTEVLLQAYITWGKSCLDRLNGMFAFAVWDRHAQKLFIARDRLGEKPLYYYSEGGRFVFASEIRALLASQLVPAKLNREVLPDYVQYQTVQAPYTLVQNVYMLLPGHCLTAEKSHVHTAVYWSPAAALQQQEPADATGSIRQLFEDSVRLRMVADVEVGAFLSGGIDSSAVVAQMSRLSKKSIHTFSVIFGEKDFSEEEFSNAIAYRYNTQHHPIRISASDFLHDLPSVLRSVDFPGGDGPNTYVVAQATRKTGIRVALSGIGGDELFAGYPVFAQLHAFHRKKMLKMAPRFARVLAGKTLARIKGGTTGKKYARILSMEKMSDAGFYALSRQLFDKTDVNHLLRQPGHGLYAVEKTAGEIFRGAPGHLLSEVSLAEMGTYLQNVLLRDTDQMTMAHALEVRAPFLDHRLVEMALSISDTLKYPHTPKQLFVKAMGDLLPPEVVNRKKMGFVFPWAHWMRNELNQYCSERLQRLASRGLFDAAALKKLWTAFENNDPAVPWSRLWHLVTLEEWMLNNHVE